MRVQLRNLMSLFAGGFGRNVLRQAEGKSPYIQKGGEIFGKGKYIG
jgi:hypothetical protein